MRPATILFVTLGLSTAVLAQAPASALPIDNTRWCAVYGGHGVAARIAAFSPGSNAWRRSPASVASASPINSTIQVQLRAPANGAHTSNRLQTRPGGIVSKKVDAP